MRTRSRSEEGYVIVVVLVLIIVAIGLAAAALTTTLSSRFHANRDERSKRAQQAADAGVQTMLYRANQTNLSALQLSNGLSLRSVIRQLLVCPIPQVNAGGNGQIAGITFTGVANAQVGSPCPSNSTSGTPNPLGDKEPVGHHASFQAYYDPGLTNVGDFVEFKPTIVASGVDDNGGTSQRYVSQRVEAILSPWIPWQTLEAEHNLTINVPAALGVSALGLPIYTPGTTAFNGTAAADNDLKLVGQGGVANAFTGSNINLSGGLTEPSALDYCNTYDPGNVNVTLVLGPATRACGTVDRPGIQISPSKPACAPTTGVVSCSSLFGSVYSATTDSIYCTSGCSALTFQPGDYVFCDFQYNGPVSLNPSSTQAVRIFIDNPHSSRCSGISGNHTGTQPTGFQPTYGNFVATHGVGNLLGSTHPSQGQVYVAGNGSNNGTVAYSTGDTTLSAQDMFLYAPTSNVTVSAGQRCATLLGQTLCTTAGTLAGAFIGWDLTVGGTAIAQDLGLLNYPLSNTLGPFHVKQYVECTPAYPLPSPATSGC